MRVHVILGAGGSGTRMKSTVNKSFLLLRGKPLLAYSLSLFQQLPEVVSVTVVIHPTCVKELTEIISRGRFDKVKRIVEGGKERQDSIRNGLVAVGEYSPRENDLVLVHNAANPLLTKELVLECGRAAQLHHASVAGYRVKDTVKRVGDDGKIIETLQRSELWGMQTPQCIEYGLFVRAHENAQKEGFYGTDDVQLVERLGTRAVVVDCGYENIKITTPEDLSIAEKILERRATNANESP